MDVGAGNWPESSATVVNTVNCFAGSLCVTEKNRKITYCDSWRWCKNQVSVFRNKVLFQHSWFSSYLSCICHAMARLRNRGRCRVNERLKRFHSSLYRNMLQIAGSVAKGFCWLPTVGVFLEHTKGCWCTVGPWEPWEMAVMDSPPLVPTRRASLGMMGSVRRGSGSRNCDSFQGCVLAQTSQGSWFMYWLLPWN